MLRALTALLLTLLFVSSATAQDTAMPDRSATGGAQTLQDILARQNGAQVDNAFRSQATGNPDSAAGMAEQLGTLGGTSDPELWRALRFGTADITTANRGPAATVLVQDGGMKWLLFRQGPLATYGAYLLIGTIVLLGLFYLIRGRITIDGEKTGHKLLRFKMIERFGHWLLAGSFLLLGLTGLISLFGRKVLIPAFGHEAFAFLAVGSKWVHNNVSWAFILGLVMILVMWVIHNLPDRTDINWLVKGGGIFSKGHPPAKKFNAGQKMIFWSVIILGTSISVSGVSLLFPFEINIFAATFAKLNALGISGLLGFGELREVLAPHEEMQYAQLWHAGVSFVLMAIILAHIYIGTVGMEGAADAMTTGEVEEQWAREHHSLWVDEVMPPDTKSTTKATPAE
ncbi:formate dehydrogenase subunit gamma [Sulfitobacter sp. M57]|uniref:formate dehydrogenase subunit gamma n=1 Tax=unclassified Sulfitobacter TaxID=196795 RepID=UPI0023E1034D|nr:MULTISPECIES: formate dehydrogenase subunit gamma [unclassified Sulfitobacter]MDF3416048.1 formate dehydrogenase subunit gamma [Sulfitobacter sp. KE5]MDF3423528.1 formate dehydrogenase subunit gamma [Sulfitobacter sp. KE43]MDF3434671.1 formate dehydrogenase subunit gamma [Sulfitobacter sp. KE42]MDF3460234.1 formate dehydrogenase subunit gamma [Sulfitobacter sp. S74]MDF3464208.1 formate dehydrogenase subunit gamma [Sulfitobacter sp. Ks18]